MQASEFRKLIREEVRRASKAALARAKATRDKAHAGQIVTSTNLDPNTVYKVNVISSRGGFDPEPLKKITNQGPPRAVALSVWRVAGETHPSFEYNVDGSVEGYKLDEDTYFIVVDEEDVTIVGKLTSKKYGKFWSLLANGDLDGARELFNKMDADSANATDLASISEANETKTRYENIKKMKLSEFKKLIREEVRKALTESKITKTKKHKLRENTQKRALNEVDVNPDPNDEISGSPGFNFDKFAKQSPVVLFSEYEGDWMEENEDWPDDFVPFQNYLYAKYVDGTDFALMVGMGDDIFNALAIKNPKVIQDPTVKKYIKKIMSYGGLEFEKGKF